MQRSRFTEEQIIGILREQVRVRDDRDHGFQMIVIIHSRAA